MENLEVREVLDYSVDNTLRILEVEFKILNDEEDEVRIDKIPFDELDNFGFGDLKKQNILDSDEDSEFGFYDLEEEYDDYEMIEFLNEYYLIFPERLPKVKIY